MNAYSARADAWKGDSIAFEECTVSAMNAVVMHDERRRTCQLTSM